MCDIISIITIERGDNLGLMKLPERHISLYIAVISIFVVCNVFEFMMGFISTIGFIITALAMAYIIICSIKNRNNKETGMENWNWLFALVMVYIFISSVYEVIHIII